MIISKEKIKKAFGKVSRDIKEFKGSMQGWVIFLDGNQRKMKARIADLERKVERLEMIRFEELRRV